MDSMLFQPSSMNLIRYATRTHAMQKKILLPRDAH